MTPSADSPVPANEEAASDSFVYEDPTEENSALREVATWNLLAVSYLKYNTCTTFSSRMPLTLGCKRKRENGLSKMLCVREMAKDVLIHLFADEQDRPEDPVVYDAEEEVHTLIVRSGGLRLLVELHNHYVASGQETKASIRMRVKDIFEILFPIQRMEENY